MSSKYHCLTCFHMFKSQGLMTRRRANVWHAQECHMVKDDKEITNSWHCLATLSVPSNVHESAYGTLDNVVSNIHSAHWNASKTSLLYSLHTRRTRKQLKHNIYAKNITFIPRLNVSIYILWYILCYVLKMWARCICTQCLNMRVKQHEIN